MGKIVNRAMMTVSGTPGTGTITLLAASTGYQSFAAAGVLDGDLISYLIEDGSNWEFGHGTYTASGTTLARTTIFASSSGGSAIAVTSSATVMVSQLAQDLQSIPVRHTVVGGPLFAGFPAFLSSTYPSLTLTTVNLAPSSPLIATAAAGFNSRGARDVIGVLTSNISWTVAANATVFLPIAISDSGVITAAAVTSLAPIYQFTGTPSVTNGQYTFNTAEMQMYLGNGSVANKVQHVIVGEVYSNASTITSAVPYSYNGYCDTGWFTPSGVGVAMIKNHLIGTNDVDVQVIWECLTSEGGYSVGDRVRLTETLNNYYCYGSVSWSRLNAAFTSTGGYGWQLNRKDTGGNYGATATNWRMKFIVRRKF